MEKKFKKMEDHLEVIVTGDQPINLPDGKETVQIGTLTNRQVQKIDLDKAPVLVKFLTDQKESADGQIKMIESQLKDLEHIDVDAISEDVVNECIQKLKTGTNGFKSKMTALNKHIESMNKKRQLTSQSEFLSKQVEPLTKELEDINEAMK